LRSTEHKYQRGQDAYYLRRALKGALDSAREGNFGVGGVVLVVGEDHVLEFQSRNLMITGDSVMQIIGHAETGGLATIMKMREDKHGKNILNKVKRSLRKGKEWSGEFGALGISAYSRNHNEDTATLRPGTHVFTTLEPCPMCTSVILNSKADFCVIGAEDAYGGAVLSGRLQKLTPAWLELAAKTTFDLYQSDPLLQELCWKIFEGTVNVNNKLLQRNLYDAIMSD
jgi:tRNA(Arg) A34 adenosine deaminase TadA